MPLVAAPGISFNHAGAHTRYPLYVDPRLGYTAEIADGIAIGSRMQATADHVLRYRYGGPVCMSNVAGGSTNLTYYIPYHYPPLPSGNDRNILLWVNWLQPGQASSTWALKIRFALGSGTYTTLASGDTDIASQHFKKVFIVQVPTPTGTGADSIGCFELYFDNCVMLSVSAYHIGTLLNDDDDVDVDAGDCGPGRVITTDTNSLGGLIEQIGTGAVDKNTMERITRRVFWNQGACQGTINQEADGAYHNQFNKMTWPCQCRDLLGDNSSHDCYPVLVAKASGFDASHDVIIKYETSASSWTYTFQAGVDVSGTTYLIHPWRTGSSSSSGIAIDSGSEDLVTISTFTDSMCSITLFAWALFEGPAY